MICNRCKKDFNEIESHHVWCKFMDNPHGYTWKENAIEEVCAATIKFIFEYEDGNK